MMTPQERTARRQTLARAIRRAISELTRDDPLLLTSMAEVARHLDESDEHLLCEAYEILIAAGGIHVAAGIIRVTAAAPPAHDLTRAHRGTVAVRTIGARRRMRCRRLVAARSGAPS